MVYIKINGVEYPAEITGRLNDSDWNGRKSKSIKLEMSYSDAIALFVDDVDWFIVTKDPVQEMRVDDNGNSIAVTVEQVEEFDNSEYSVAGAVIDHRDGYVTVKMGIPTAEELLDMIQEGLAQ